MYSRIVILMATTQHSINTRAALRSTALATLLAAIVLLTLLGHNRLTDWDEGIYAQVSREMLTSGWLIPHWNLQVWIDKPPLTYWITALFFRLFGVSELTARLGSALAGIATVALLHGWLLLRPIGNATHARLTAWLSSLILLTTFGFLHVVRVGETDTLLSFGCLLAVIGLAEVHRDNLSGWYLYWLGFAIALMSKGAASGTLFFTLIALAFAGPAFFRTIRREFALGFALFLALVLPWHLFMLQRFGQVFVKQYLGLHVIGRVAYQFDGHLTPWWYFFRVLLLSAPPFVLLYPIAIASGLRQRVLRPFAVFVLVQFIAFTCIQTRLPHYVAPTYAPFAALVAVWIVARLDTITLTRSLRVQLTAATVALWLLSAWATAAPRSRLHSPRLPNGDVTPNNREQVALLKQVFTHPSPAVAAIPGPLLDWRPGHYNPIPTVIFYANRTVQQVQLQPLPPGTPTGIYSFNPEPLATTVGPQPSLIFLDRALLEQLPADYTFSPIATSPTLAVGTIAHN
jgi:4-amino-4-deoxy-L-arabinose transferase-like glycosyltransferase